MTAKEFLRGIRGHNQRIKALMERRQYYYDIAQGTGSGEPPRIGGGNQSSRVENAVHKLMELEEDLNKEIDRLVDEVRLAERLIDKLEDSRHRDVLKFRYLNGWSWETITDEMGYEKRYIFKLHGEALVKIDTQYLPSRSKQ